MKSILITFIKIYRITLSPMIGNNCRFTPTCSVYAQESIDKYGGIKGSWMTIKRLVKCHPFNKSNPIDPVP